MRSLRFRVRTLMILVATVAIVIVSGMTANRWWTYRYRARVSGEAVVRFQGNVDDYETQIALDRLESARGKPVPKPHSSWAAKIRDEEESARVNCGLSEWAAGLERKYRRATSRPWEAVPRDKPYRGDGFGATPEWSSD